MPIIPLLVGYFVGANCGRNNYGCNCNCGCRCRCNCRCCYRR